MTITFEKESNEVWWSEYSIKDNGCYVGFIAKNQKLFM